MIRHKQITKLKPEFVEKKLQAFFNEDNISEDITTNTTQQKGKTVEAHFVAKEDMVFAGKEIICFGAARSAPFIFLLLEIGDKMSFAIDDNPMKMGKFLPISNIPIYDSKYVRKYKHNSELSFLIAGWAQTERILKYLRSQFSGHAACIFPNFEIVEL